MGKGDWRRRAAVERAHIEENFDAIDWSQDVGKVFDFGVRPTGDIEFDGEKFVLKEENDDDVREGEG